MMAKEKDEQVSSKVGTMYTLGEIVMAARKLFPYSSALVYAALSETGIWEFTLEEARAVVEAFAARQVKG